MPAGEMTKLPVPCWVTVRIGAVSVPPKRAVTLAAVIVDDPVRARDREVTGERLAEDVELEALAGDLEEAADRQHQRDGRAVELEHLVDRRVGIVLTWTRRSPLSATCGTLSAIVPPKSPAMPALVTSSVPDALRTVSTPPPSVSVHVGEREPQHLRVGVRAAVDAVGAERQ